MNLKLEDLVPMEVTFKLSSKGDKEYTLKRFSLREQIWIRNKYGSVERVQQIFKTMDLVAISEIAHHLLKDKTDFPTFLDFAECIITHEDKVAVMKGMLSTIGISQPLFDKIEQEEIQKQAEQDATTPKE
jgi:hypothetical protein